MIENTSNPGLPRTIFYLKSVVNVIHRLRCFIPKDNQGVLVHNESMGEHVTPVQCS